MTRLTAGIQRRVRGVLRRLRHPWVVFAHDLAMIPVAWFGALWLRFNLETIPREYLDQALLSLPWVLLIQVYCFVRWGLYRGDWRFASMPDLVRIGKVVLVGVVASGAALFLVYRLQHTPRSLLPLYGLLLGSGLALPRLVYRWFKDSAPLAGEAQRVLIAGAGSSGEMLARDILRNPQCGLYLVGFVDDNRRCQGMEVQGLRVWGTTRDLARVVERTRADLVLLAMPSASSNTLRELVRRCEEAGVPFRTLPRMEDLLHDRVSVHALRRVAIEDLLGRDPVRLDLQQVDARLAGRRVLVSGGGGSIGSELCRQLASLRPERLIVLERNEFALYQLEAELRASHPELRLVPLLGDVTDADTVAHWCRVYRPQVVMHAAAYKHVPMLEPQIREAVWNNVIGTEILATTAARHGAETFVLVSTDKAVNPANIMGATKRCAEIVCQSLAEAGGTRFVTVRFGNVVGSAGSVVPLFQRQIQAGGPVTVTDPAMERFFITIPEACQLILQASSMGQGGEIFVLDMGEPISITYLAEQMIHLAGYEPGVDIDIVYTGVRPGEKLSEQLFHQREAERETGHEKIRLAEQRRVNRPQVVAVLEALRQACARYDTDALQRQLAALVPEMQASPGMAPRPADDKIIPFDSRGSA